MRIAVWTSRLFQTVAPRELKANLGQFTATARWPPIAVWAKIPFPRNVTLPPKWGSKCIETGCVKGLFPNPFNVSLALVASGGISDKGL
jgi:hypothetical protein